MQSRSCSAAPRRSLRAAAYSWTRRAACCCWPPTCRPRPLARLTRCGSFRSAKQVVFGGAAPQPPRGRVFLDPARGVLLLASNLPPAPTGKTYEMWIIPKAKGSRPVPAGLFQSAADGTALHVRPGPVDVAATGIVAVTLEPAAGVPQPTSQPIIVAAL